MKEVKALVGLDPNDRFDEAVWKHYKATIDDQVAADELLKTDRMDFQDGMDHQIIQVYTDPEGQEFASLVGTSFGMMYIRYVDESSTVPCLPGEYVHHVAADDGKPAYIVEGSDDE